MNHLSKKEVMSSAQNIDKEANRKKVKKETSNAEKVIKEDFL